MLFWHLGLTWAIVFFALGARRIDYRVVLLGAVLPDLIDKPVGRIFFEEQFQTSRLFGHTLLFVTVLLLAIQLVLRGRTARRWFILPIAALIHLVLDGMWNHPVTLFWPLFSTTFPPDPVDNYWLEMLLRPFEEPWELVKELVGLGIFVYLIRAFELQIPARRRDFVREGKLYSGVDRSPQGEGPLENRP
jgi:inner membrane protein